MQPWEVLYKVIHRNPTSVQIHFEFADGLVLPQWYSQKRVCHIDEVVVLPVQGLWLTQSPYIIMIFILDQEFANRWVPMNAIGQSYYPPGYESQLEKPFMECTFFNFIDRGRRLQPLKLDSPVNHNWRPAVVPITISDDEGEKTEGASYAATTVTRPGNSPQEDPQSKLRGRYFISCFSNPYLLSFRIGVYYFCR